MIVKITVKHPIMRDGTRVFWMEAKDMEDAMRQVRGLPIERMEVVG
ncbi:hypothetical protein [Sulfodiicoccus acidiphilus]|nr:hypothetical protein [Sulfodiicoccus acidiphilus]